MITFRWSRAISRPAAIAAALVVATTAPWSAVSTEASLILTNASQIRALSLEEAQSGRRVLLRGVVLDYHADSGTALFIHDGTAGIYIGDTRALKVKLKPGDQVEVEGIATPGQFAPMVSAARMQRLGEGELPRPREVSFERLSSGREDSQWVSVRGIIRSAVSRVVYEEHLLFLDVATGGGRLDVRVRNPGRASVGNLVGSEVRVTGVCIPHFNLKRQLLSVRISVPELNWVEIERPGAPDAFALPTRSVNHLLRFDLHSDSGHRVKVSGVVTFFQQGQVLFLRDPTQGLWVKTGQIDPLQPGDQIEVVGFPASGEYTPGLEDAVFRKKGAVAPIVPIQVSAAEAAEGYYDAELVRLEGEVLHQFRNTEEEVLVLQEGQVSFRAHLAADSSADRQLDVQPGSRVQLTGICVAQSGNQRFPQSFRLLLRSPQDVVVLRAAPFWTLRRTLWVLSLLSIGLCVALAWIVTLRRRVNAQTCIIRRNLEKEAIHDERTRIAREFHDTLEQALVGIGMQLGAARSMLADSEAPREALAMLDTARGMIRHSEAEVKRSVWNLRNHALERQDLPGAISSMTARLLNGAPVRVQFKLSGHPRRLPGRVETHLLRISQEATTNALKHARCSQVRIDLSYASNEVSLAVEDDGQGFCSDGATESEGLHFGLLGMRERAEKIGGSFSIESSPGRATRIQVRVPVKSEATISHPRYHEEKDPRLDR